MNVNGGDQQLAEVGVPRLGKWDELRSLIPQHQVQEAIIAVESSEQRAHQRILNELDGTAVRIKDHPGHVRHSWRGSVKMTSIFGAPLIEVNPRSCRRGNSR
ncbi:MAG: hypothetical protein IPL86_15575 [Flavobacteriales bacterium]|nr:hypothetical protein [Flavobacteriales bacterium]